jgi:hypothetical protein
MLLLLVIYQLKIQWENTDFSDNSSTEPLLHIIGHEGHFEIPVSLNTQAVNSKILERLPYRIIILDW